MKIVKVARNRFKSTNIKSTGGRHHGVTGDLTIHGVTKSVTLTVEYVSKTSNDPWEHQLIGLSGSAKVNRKGFGLMGNSALESDGVLVMPNSTGPSFPRMTSLRCVSCASGVGSVDCKDQSRVVFPSCRRNPSLLRKESRRQSTPSNWFQLKFVWDAWSEASTTTSTTLVTKSTNTPPQRKIQIVGNPSVTCPIANTGEVRFARKTQDQRAL